MEAMDFSSTTTGLSFFHNEEAFTQPHDHGEIEMIAGRDEEEEQNVETSAEPTERVKPFLFVVMSMVAMGGVLYGLDLGSVGATYVMDGFRQHVNWDLSSASSVTSNAASTVNRDKGLISFFFGIGATLGAIANPYVAEKYGRRPSLVLSTLLYTVGGIIQTYLPTMELLWIGRFFVGLGVGALSMVAPVYIVECSPQHARGLFGIFYDLSTSFGIMLGSATVIGFKQWQGGWRFAYGIGLPFAILLLLALLFKVIPESPRWLAAHGSQEELAQALRTLRYEEELESETAILQGEVQEKREMGEATWKEVFSTRNMMRRRVLLGVFFFLVQQLGGLAAVMFYAPDILNTFFTEDQAIQGTLAFAVLGFLATLASAFSVDRLGRTKLLVYGGLCMFLCLIPLAIVSSLENQNQAVGWAVLVLSSVFIVSSSLSWGPALYVLCSEMFPFRTRSKATGVTSTSHWLFGTIAGAVFPIASAISLSGCFVFFAICILLGTSAVYFLQVETNGRSFAQIDEAFLLHKPTFKRKDW